jgi:hypothetical protein
VRQLRVQTSPVAPTNCSVHAEWVSSATAPGIDVCRTDIDTPLTPAIA